MDILHNPFSPGAGTPPPELIGRDNIVQQAITTLARIKNGRSEKSVLLVGLRGTGKTVLLRKFEDLAKTQNYQTVFIEADERRSLPLLLVPELRRLLFTLDNDGQTNSRVKRALRVLKSFVGSIKVTAKISDIEFGIGIDAELGAADSGDLDSDLSHLFAALGEAAKERNTAIAIIIDEIQYLKDSELGALIMAIHNISQKSLPVTLFGAGLPQLVGNAGRAKSYAERLFDYPELGPLSSEDAKLALQKPVQKEGAAFTDEALNEIIHVTRGYPYFLQEWGYQSWNLADKSPIDTDTVKLATTVSIKKLDQNFFRVRFDRLTPKEKEYLRALAELGDRTQRSGDIANLLGIDVQKAAPNRNNLIKKGMIYSPGHGDTAFTVPLFDEFMKRIMPQFPSQL